MLYSHPIMERKIRTVPIIRTVNQERVRSSIKTVLATPSIRTSNAGQEREFERQPIQTIPDWEKIEIRPYDSVVSPDFKTLGDLIKWLNQNG